MDNHGITIFTTYISLDLAHHKILRAKVGKGAVNISKIFMDTNLQFCGKVTFCKTIVA